MKSGNPEKAYIAWKKGQVGLRLVAKIVDRVIEACAEGKTPKTSDLELIASGILHLKLSVGREERENMKAELQARRERIELHDLEIAAKLRRVDNESLLRALESASSVAHKPN